MQGKFVAAVAIGIVFSGQVEAQEEVDPHSSTHTSGSSAQDGGALAASEPEKEPTLTQEVQESITIGDDTTKDIPTDLDGHLVPADIGQLYIGNTVQSADAITIDSGANFPGGIAFRRHLGTADNPQVVTPGTQLGYLDFRGYSGGKYFNAGSLDVVVDGRIPFEDGSLMPTKMRFAVSNGESVYVGMELLANGRLEIGAIRGSSYFGPDSLGSPNFYVNSAPSSWGAIFASHSTDQPNFAIKTYSATSSAGDFLYAGQTNEGLMFSVRGNGDLYTAGNIYAGGVNLGSAILANKTLADEAIDIAATAYARAEQAYALANEATQTTANNIAVTGDGDAVAAPESIAIGASATSEAEGALAFGTSSRAAGKATAIGNGTTARGIAAVALGSGARANADAAMSLGNQALASAAQSTAIGSQSTATAEGAVALGATARAIRSDSVAIGTQSLAQGANGIAVGNVAAVTADRAIAIGYETAATHEGSTAIGSGARTTANDQVMLGGAGTSVAVADIDASTEAQVGPVDVVTIDASGTLGRQRVATASSVSSVAQSMNYIAAVSEAQFSALDSRVLTLESSVNALFDLTSTIDRDARQGIAAIAAMAQPHFPSEQGKTSYASNVATYRGEFGISAGIMHRLGQDFAVTAGATYAGGESATFKAGVAGEF